MTVEPATTIEKAVEIMLKNKIRKFPIVYINETIVGIITVTDLVMFSCLTTKPETRFNIINTTNSLKRERTKDVIHVIDLLFEFSKVILSTSDVCYSECYGRPDNAMVLLFSTGTKHNSQQRLNSSTVENFLHK